MSEGLPIEVTCRVVGVSVSGFYMWRHRKPSARAVRHAMVAEVIRQVHDESRQTYGARRVHAELVLGRKMTVARCTVELVMRRLGLAGLPGRPRYRKIPNTPTASDLVNRDFARTEPNRLWLTDITEHRTREGKVYCAVVLDAFSRRVVGWSIDSSQTANLVVNALGMAIENRQAEGVVIHSDHGTQYTSWAFTRRAARLRAGAVDGIDRRLLRQRPDGVVLGADASRAAQPQALEHPPRAGQRDLRVP